MKRSLLALTIVVALAAAPAVAHAGGWLPEQSIGTRGMWAQLSSTLSDTSAAAYLLDDPARDVFVLDRATGSFVEGPAVADGATVYALRSTANARGDVLATWNEHSGGIMRLRMLLRDAASGEWHDSYVVDSEDVSGASALAINATGQVLVVWRDGTGVRALRTAVSEPGPYVAESVLPGEGLLGNTSATLDDAGNATAAWVNNASVLRSVTRAAGDTAWSAPETVVGTTPGISVTVGLATAASGAVTLAWTLTSSTSQLWSQTRRADQTWSDTSPVLVASGSGMGSKLAVGRSGRRILAWSEYSGGDWHVTTSTAPADGVWSSPQQVADTGGSIGLVDVVVSGDDDATVVWRTGAPRAIHARREAGGVWQPDELVGETTPTSEFISVSANSTGDTLVSWLDSTSPQSFAKARLYDGSPPRVDSSSIPAHATVGVPYTVSAKASDTWSASPSVTWNFGDGTPPSAATTHTYTRAGTYIVTAIVKDDADNAASSSRAVSVAAAPDPTATPSPTPTPTAPPTTPTPTPTPPVTPPPAQQLIGIVPPGKPGTTLAIKPTQTLRLGCRLRTETLKTCTVDVFATPNGNITISRVHGKLVGRATITLATGATTATVKLKLNRAGRRMLNRHTRGLTLSIRARATDSTGNALRTLTQLRVKQARRR